MALFNLIIAGLTAILVSFLSLSPNVFHGLVPWIERLSTPPMSPSPSAYTAAMWEEIPWVNLSAVDLASPPPTTPAPSFSTDDKDDQEPFVVPTPASSFSVDDDDDQEAPPPESEEPKWEEALGELWRVFKEALLILMMSNHQFLLEYPWIAGSKPTCHLRRVHRLPRARLPGRSRGRVLSSSLIRRPRAARTRARVYPPAPASPVVSPPASPTASSPTPASPTVPLASSPPPTSPPPPTPPKERRATDRRQQDRIDELERTVAQLTSELEKMRVAALPTSPVAAAPLPPPPPPRLNPRVHPAPPPLHPPTIGAASHPPHHFSPARPSYPPHHFNVMPLPNPPIHLSLADFQARYPQTGKKAT
ncbi:hypothetical protein MMC07_004158 [Pseudocyphellaria aurata]|nr:hypothetical protein [Pseudocyphellaria aurata]